MEPDDGVSELTRRIIGCAMAVHRALGPGFIEAVYHNALMHELRKIGLRVEVKPPLQVVYDGVIVGEFLPDAVVESSVILELKGVERIAKAHEVQLVNYLTVTRIDIGLQINFGAASLEFKRKYRLRNSDPENPVNPVNPV
jgi:GxxExxY protein